MAASSTLEIVEKISFQITAEKEELIPQYASKGAAGADLRANITQDIIIPKGEFRLIPTGLKFEIPEGFEVQIRPRSGLALKFGVTVLNTPGTIDADYRGEIGVILMNHGPADFIVTPLMRIAQMVVASVVTASFIPTQSLSSSERGAGGFGHTGTS